MPGYDGCMARSEPQATKALANPKRIDGQVIARRESGEIMGEMQPKGF